MEALYPAAFLIDRDEERWLAHGVNRVDQRLELLQAREVSGEQDDPADRR
jgi:hypothetical protein